MKKLKQNKGITLIALIITIIVMLLLVGVTINIALNGGIFDQANKAAKDMQIEADKEILQSAVYGAMDNSLRVPNAKAIKDNLPSGWEVTGPDGGQYTCKSPDKNVFIITANGKITETGSGLSGDGNDSGVDQLTGTTLISIYCGLDNCTNEEHLHIGDYVDYNPSTTTTVYYPDGQDEAKIGQYTGWKVEESGILQTVQQDNLNWRVFGVEGDKVLLISEQPTENGIGFDGYIAYNNYERLLYEACNTLYSNTYSNGATAQARSIVLADITQRTGTNEIVSSDVYAIDEQTGDLTLGGTTNSITLNCKGFLSTEDSTIDNLMSSENAKKRELIQGQNKSIYYWIGTRACYKASNGAIKFAPFALISGEIAKSLAWASLTSATEQEGGGEALPLRPIVELSSGVTTEQVPVIGESLN